jgi:hypothetical protein
MAPRYQVRLKNLAGVQVAILTDWYDLKFHRKVNGVDSCTLEIDGNIAVLDEFVLDGQIEVWRSDLAADPVIPIYLEYEGFHRTEVRRTALDGRATFSSIGMGYDHLLARRIILYATGSAQADKAAVGETVMKEFVDENAGPGATSPPRLLSAGVMAGLTIQADGAAGAVWTGARAYRILLDILVEVARDSDVDFGIIGTGPATFEFQAQASPWGDDRTTTGLDPATGLNGAGNPPVIFSLPQGNMEIPLYSNDRRDEVTSVIVLGQGQEADRLLVERTDAAAIAESTWNRIERPRQGNTEDAVAGLNSIGDEALESLQAKEVFRFNGLQIPATLYGRDYFLGDLVTARYNDIERNKKIVGVQISVQRGVERIILELSDVPLS